MVPLTSAYGAWVVFSIWLVRPRAHLAWAFHLAVVGDLLIGLGVCLGLVVASGNPMTLVPLLAIPIFQASGAAPGPAIAGPVIAAGFSAMCYHFLAQRTELGRTLIRAREAAQHARAASDMQSQRERIARDVHDSVGSALGMAALYGDLAAQGKFSDAALTGILGEVGTSARSTLQDLRAVLNGIDPHEQRVADLVVDVRQLGERATARSDMRLEVAGHGDLKVMLAPTVVVTALRLIQESVTNAVRHSGARSLAITVTVGPAPGGRLGVQVADDGVGFEPMTARGRGLAGMRARATALKGAVRVDSAVGGGTRVHIDLPTA